MGLQKKDDLEMVSKEILNLRNLMYMAKDRAGNMVDPMVIEISQLLDAKLNQHHELIELYKVEKRRNGYG
ncbi:Spo0E family sporulation regulatory protein-aspartic acid phosphatase [Aquibacillus halophilus]|uniref:Spo0E family sporulation regulatory protein-aspartic acid phosphatase n=1 Tax=Aquibacillus halophilus TaxID=930132 RepID=A0A6A8DJ28_9BACI|nr:Spo0E family sporulation regulatory protein-aspartic acid phosphatase [Aquibacillus halophilus]MRH44476.1 Spo0E family sporulation regulatory protein-aspartic acid phosphatase [Aquibacillus halophilus]